MLMIPISHIFYDEILFIITNGLIMIFILSFMLPMTTMLVTHANNFYYGLTTPQRMRRLTSGNTIKTARSYAREAMIDYQDNVNL